MGVKANEKSPEYIEAFKNAKIDYLEQYNKYIAMGYDAQDANYYALHGKPGDVKGEDEKPLMINGVITEIKTYMSVSKGFWEDGSGYDYNGKLGDKIRRNIKMHKVIMDTWKPLYDNPPEGIVWEEWEIARDLPTVYDHISKTVVIDHIDDDPTNNHLDNLRRTNSWDNNFARKARGI